MRIVIAFMLTGCVAAVGEHAPPDSAEYSEIESECPDCDRECVNGGFCDGLPGHCVCYPDEYVPEPLEAPPLDPFAWSCGSDVCLNARSFGGAHTDCAADCRARANAGDCQPRIQPHVIAVTGFWEQWWYCDPLQYRHRSYWCTCIEQEPEPEPDPFVDYYTPSWCPWFTDLCWGGCSAEYAVCCCDDWGLGVWAAGERSDGTRSFAEPAELPAEFREPDVVAGASRSCEWAPGVPMDWESSPHEHSDERHYHCVGDDMVWCEHGCCDANDVAIGGCS